MNLIHVIEPFSALPTVIAEALLDVVLGIAILSLLGCFFVAGVVVRSLATQALERRRAGLQQRTAEPRPVHILRRVK